MYFRVYNVAYLIITKGLFSILFVYLLVYSFQILYLNAETKNNVLFESVVELQYKISWWRLSLCRISWARLVALEPATTWSALSVVLTYSVQQRVQYITITFYNNVLDLPFNNSYSNKNEKFKISTSDPKFQTELDIE